VTTMHPGEYLAMSYVEPYNISQIELSAGLGLPLPDIERLLAEEIELTAEMALRLELAFDRSAASWLTMQAEHSLMQARKKVDPDSVRRFALPLRVGVA
jgi:addiction module HigA family antidote